MELHDDYQLLINTCPNLDLANKIAHSLIENHLAACVNLIPNIQSVFEWQQQVVSETEVILLIKTRAQHYSDIEQLILQQHPYQVPELIAIPITTGLPKYLAWLDEVVARR